MPGNHTDGSNRETGWGDERSSRAAALAFDAVAPVFDERFGAWASVAAQRRAVRAVLLRTFPPGGRVLELGGGTGEDAAFLASHGYDILLTDPSPAMVSLAQAKLAPLWARGDRRRRRNGRLRLALSFGGRRAVRRSLLQFCTAQLRNGSGPGRAWARTAAQTRRSGSSGSLRHVLSRRNRHRTVAQASSARRCGDTSAVHCGAPGRPRIRLSSITAARPCGGLFSHGLCLKNALESESRFHPAPPSRGFRRTLGFSHAMENLDRFLSRPLADLGDHVLLSLSPHAAPLTMG